MNINELVSIVWNVNYIAWIWANVFWVQPFRASFSTVGRSTNPLKNWNDCLMKTTEKLRKQLAEIPIIPFFPHISP
jgi:hypothetical protein